MVLSFHALFPAFPLQAADLPLAREGYSDAVRAISRGQWTEYQRLRPGLEEYPLAMYLDYYELSRKTRQVRPGDANLFLQRSEGSPLPNRFLAGYLSQAGRDGRWRDFLAVMADEPNSIDLKCYYFRARLAEGDPLVAWEGAERLWVHGESRPKACDPLFAAWQKAGQLSDDIVWARLLKAFEARQRSLMSYVARKGSDSLRPWSERLLEVYRSPDRMRSLVPVTNDPRTADIVAYGTAYFARYKPVPALQQWLQYKGQMQFSEPQLALAEGALALRSLFAKSPENLPWVEEALARLGDDSLVEIRLRWALQEQEWAAVAANLQKLSPSARGDAGWRYWQAVVHQRAGERELAEALLRGVSQERDYYGFLAAERLGLPPTFNHRVTALAPGRTEPLRQLPVVRRIEELYHHKEENLAHSEWYQVLQRTSPQEQQELATLASTLGWHRMAIDAANKAEAWDALSLRFPTPYQDTFSRHASTRQVAVTELMAIARRESAFYAGARSPVGARGLMQVMPATGKQVATQIKANHSDQALYDVEHNVLLGSAYYRQLLDRYGDNRVLAMAAYNAGPHRVDRWRNKPEETVPVDVWIETIPFRETRNYVKAVLAYNLVFKYLLGQEGTLLTEQERRLTY
ncbi:transglycosylase SLT domain-containing protein [Haliea sp. E1-2-M8]|uniref:transglycosylase SLT domain-containing protein n=1 Tax=Haliea sp. E1-2-M8 TaxID=3064706 RepID=UPI0027163B1C|nr:transglycosylase SLT domain-containing protein [Haliea sp. E1-2-M8]MDO8862829.1 transglycosylase SLT domain-containing protein [Haliea sp. E1-2-M8]